MGKCRYSYVNQEIVHNERKAEIKKALVRGKEYREGGHNLSFQSKESDNRSPIARIEYKSKISKLCEAEHLHLLYKNPTLGENNRVKYKTPEKNKYTGNIGNIGRFTPVPRRGQCSSMPTTLSLVPHLVEGNLHWDFRGNPQLRDALRKYIGGNENEKVEGQCIQSSHNIKLSSPNPNTTPSTSPIYNSHSKTPKMPNYSPKYIKGGNGNNALINQSLTIKRSSVPDLTQPVQSSFTQNNQNQNTTNKSQLGLYSSARGGLSPHILGRNCKLRKSCQSESGTDVQILNQNNTKLIGNAIYTKVLDLTQYSPLSLFKDPNSSNISANKTPIDQWIDESKYILYIYIVKNEKITKVLSNSSLKILSKFSDKYSRYKKIKMDLDRDVQIVNL